jgi:hypothetical protein
MTKTIKNPLQKPKHEALQNAYVIVCNAHKACSAFLRQFHEIRKFRNAKGTATDSEQDLLRAMLIFACSGLDSMVKQLIRDALAKVIRNDDGAEAMFMERTKKYINKNIDQNIELLIQSIVSYNPRDVLTQNLISELVAGSLQSVDELFRVASFFNIPSKKLIDNPSDLKEIFKTRNQISHEMDIDFSQSNRNRRPRAMMTMINYTEQIFKVSESFLEETQNKLN